MIRWRLERMWAAAVALWLAMMATTSPAAKRVAYIHGDVAADGTIPSGSKPPFHQMLLTDTGNLGGSQFRELIEAQGYTVSQHYDQATSLNEAFLSQFDVIVFGLHQKVWSQDEKDALHHWILAGGGILMYSDSAAGGDWQIVGMKNTVGQMAVNNILTRYGMQVSVDIGGGTRAYTSPEGSSNPIVWDRPILEGEGVSPVAVDEASGARALIPFEEAYKISGTVPSLDTRNIAISTPRWAAVAHQAAGEGNIIAIFDRQPVWNNGPGSNIQKRNNREILRRIIRFLARDLANSDEWFGLRAQVVPRSSDGCVFLELSYRQWARGTGIPGVDYSVRNTLLRAQYCVDLRTGVWIAGADIAEPTGRSMDQGDETERVTVRLLPTGGGTAVGFARLRRVDANAAAGLSVSAGRDTVIGESGEAWLEGAVTGGPVESVSWSKVSGPGDVVFADPASATTTATFSVPGRYLLALTARNGTAVETDTVGVRVVANADVVRAINCGGGIYVGANGFTYEADTLYTGGHVDNFPGNPVAQTGDSALYNTARSKHSAYIIPVVNGKYTVFFQFAETYFTAANKRVFSFAVEGTQIHGALDLFATAGGKWVAWDEMVTTTVSDGVLDLTFDATVNNSLLNALLVIRHE